MQQLRKKKLKCVLFLHDNVCLSLCSTITFSFPKMFLFFYLLNLWIVFNLLSQSLFFILDLYRYIRYLIEPVANQWISFQRKPKSNQWFSFQSQINDFLSKMNQSQINDSHTRTNQNDKFFFKEESKMLSIQFRIPAHQIEKSITSHSPAITAPVTSTKSLRVNWTARYYMQIPSLYQKASSLANSQTISKKFNDLPLFIQLSSFTYIHPDIYLVPHSFHIIFF